VGDAVGREDVLLDLHPHECQGIGGVVYVMDSLRPVNRLSGGVERRVDQVVSALLPMVGPRRARRAADPAGRREGQRPERRGVARDLRLGREGEGGDDVQHRRCYSWMNVILKPSGSETANAQSPQGVSDGSRSSGQPVALTRAATALMSCAVDAQSRNPSPFFRSRPFAKSSWPSMMSQAPAFICMPRSPPPLVSQRSPGVKPSTSRYHATLRCRSLTVNDAAMERSRNDSGCWRGGRERGGRLEAALFGCAGRLDFRFVAIVRLL